MATGDPLSGVGGCVKKTGGDTIANVLMWDVTSSRSTKRYAPCDSGGYKRSAPGVITQSGTMTVVLEEGERDSDIAIEGARFQVDFQYDASNYKTGYIVVTSVKEGVNMDEGQVNNLEIEFDVDGKLTNTGVVAGGSAA